MSAPEITPLIEWLGNKVPPDQWSSLKKLHYQEEPFYVVSYYAPKPSFSIWPLSSIPIEHKERKGEHKNEISRKRFVDAGYDLPGYRVRFDLVAAYVEEMTTAYVMFAAAKTGTGFFCETLDRVSEYVDSYCMGKWCFYNKAFHFQEEGDALMTNAYVYS